MISGDKDISCNIVYFNYKSKNDSWAYWTASPVTPNNSEVFVIDCGGGISNNGHNGWYTYNGFRPIICLKSNVLLKELPEGSDYDFELSF